MKVLITTEISIKDTYEGNSTEFVRHLNWINFSEEGPADDARKMLQFIDREELYEEVKTLFNILWAGTEGGLLSSILQQEGHMKLIEIYKQNFPSHRLHQIPYFGPFLHCTLIAFYG